LASRGNPHNLCWGAALEAGAGHQVLALLHCPRKAAEPVPKPLGARDDDLQALKAVLSIGWISPGVTRPVGDGRG
jgi:hypothetical protein